MKINNSNSISDYSLVPVDYPGFGNEVKPDPFPDQVRRLFPDSIIFFP